MKKIYYAVILHCLFFALPLKAQDVDTLSNRLLVNSSEGRLLVSIAAAQNNDSDFSVAVMGLEVGFGSKDRSRKNKAESSWKLGSSKIGFLEFGFNGLTPSNYSAYTVCEEGFLDLRNGKSTYWAFNIFTLSKYLNKARTISIDAGLGLKFRDYTFANDLTIERIDGMIRPVAIDASFSKSKLSTFSLTLPVILSFQSRGFYFSAGVYGDMVLEQHTKYKKPVFKNHKDKYLNLLDAGLSARAGYGDLYIFGTYGLTPLFRNGRGPWSGTYSIGFGLR